MAQAMFQGQGATLLLFFVTLLILVYIWFIARTALDVSGWIAALLVAADIGIAIAIDLATVSLANG